MIPAHACVSVDLDGLWCYREIHGLERRGAEDIDAAYSVGVRRLLDAFDDWGIRATLFAIGCDAERPAHASMLREAHRAGHEIASHSWAHDYGLRHRRIWEIRDDLHRAHHAIEAAVGEAPVGFRAPGYNIDPRMLSVCAELGYRYDSSVFPCPPYWLAKAGVMAWLRLRGRPSRSSMTKIDTLRAPLEPYRPHPVYLHRRDPDSRLPLEVPMCVVPGARFPIIGTSLHLLGARGFAAVYPALRVAHPRLLNLEFHAIDFMDSRDPGTADLLGIQPDLAVPWEQKRALYADVLGRVESSYAFATLRDAVEAEADRVSPRRADHG